MTRRSLRHLGTALMLLVAFLSQATWTLASVTGGLTGTVVDADTSAPIAGAQVTATSPSQSATVTTDAAGHFSFLTLGPDTYTVTVSKTGYQPTSVPGQIVFADTVQTVAVRMPKALKTIARVTSAAGAALVKSGTTADLYSVNAVTQQATAALGGGGSLNQAYSAIATIPGAYVVPNQSGYYETVNIRGGDYDQVGYEFDGVPVTRSFDNYGTSAANSLGNAEVEVYNGAVPADSEGQGLAGYINQVIKSGTFPGYATASLGIGTPVFYHRAAVEIGGATPDRLFSYYVGIGASNQAYDYVNTNNATEYSPNFGIVQNLGGFSPEAATLFPHNSLYAPQCLFGTAACFGPNELAMGPLYYGNFSTIYARDVVANFHIGIPHRYDAGRDDVQLLYDNESLQNQLYESPNDFASPQCGNLGGTACATALYGPQVYPNSLTWKCGSAIGSAVTATSAHCVTTYGFPNAANPGSFTDPNPIPTNVRDSTYNQTVISKLQYTKNFGSTAFLRIYGYTYFSAWTLAGVLGDLDCNFSCTAAPDYELYTHTRGLSANFQDQINEQNLVSLQGNYTTASVSRDNNHFFNVPGEMFAPIVSTAHPYSGFCYGTIPAGLPGAGKFGLVNCANTFESAPAYGGLTIGQIGSGLPLTGLSCGGSPCEYLVAENGLNAEITPGLVPNFYGWSLQDQYRPNDKWLIIPGVRLDTFAFAGGDELVPPLGPNGANVAAVRQFWWNAFNNDNCQNTKTGVVFPNPSPGQLCPKGSIRTYMYNATNQNFAFNIWQPRLAGTYTSDPNNVIRFSAGRYTEAGNTAFEQYGTRQIDSADFIGPTFLQYGRNTPGYPIQPQTSLNYDISLEHHFKGTDLSFKLTPFLRQTQNQIQEFFLNAKEGFVSGLNTGNQRSEGVEFQLQKGDFSRNGVSGLLSFAYTNAYIKYQAINTYGATVLTGVNTAIAQYNAYTKTCATNPGNPNCGTTSNGLTAGPCYKMGTPVGFGPGGHCPAGTIANPYWSAPIQSTLSTTANYPTYDIFPPTNLSGGTTSLPGTYAAFGAPYVASMVVNYKHDKYAITPSLQFVAGSRYGFPLSSVGIDPVTCPSSLPGTTRYNAAACGLPINIPDPYTGGFDTLGAFTQPNLFMLNMQVSYEVSPRIQLVGTMANIVNYCWGGTKEPWSINDGNVCSFANPPSLLAPIAPYGTPGAYINPPGSKEGAYIIQRAQQYPYFPTFGPALPASALNFSTKTPFQFYLTANVKI